MNRRYLFVLLALCLVVGAAAPLTAQTNSTNATADLQALVGKINAKLSVGQRAETNLTEEIAAFDALVDKYKTANPDAAAQILFARIKLYVEVLGNPQRGLEQLRQLKKELPDTGLGKEADQIIADVQRQLDAIRMQHNLVPGALFPEFEGKDLDGKPVSVAQYKGKVLLIDFWATWCVPCQMQLPYVRKAYDQYHERGFDIIGISLDQDEQRLQGFLQDKKMSWRQIFEGHGWDNNLVRKYAVQAIPATFLLDPQGKILARDLKGDTLIEAVAKALPETRAEAGTTSASH